MNSLTVVLPAYNEQENIETLFSKWKAQRDTLSNKYGLKLHVVVVDDGSSDRTSEIAERIEKEETDFTLVSHHQNRGLGEAMKTGINHFLSQCPDSQYMCLMDCDNTQDPFYISDMLDCAYRDGADVAIASRYRDGAEVRGVSGIRLLMSQGARFVFSILLRVPGVRDYTCGYRLYAREILLAASERYGDKLVEESGFTCMVELLYKLYRCGAVFSEIPFKLRYDHKIGASKMSVLKTAFRSILLALRLKKIKGLR